MSETTRNVTSVPPARPRRFFRAAPASLESPAAPEDEDEDDPGPAAEVELDGNGGVRLHPLDVNVNANANANAATSTSTSDATPSERAATHAAARVAEVDGGADAARGIRRSRAARRRR